MGVKNTPKGQKKPMDRLTTHNLLPLIIGYVTCRGREGIKVLRDNNDKSHTSAKTLLYQIYLLSVSGIKHRRRQIPSNLFI